MAKRQNKTKSVAERISDVAQKWFLMDPLLFAAYCTHSTEENISMLVPIRCGKGKIQYNPQLLQDESDDVLADRVKVEVLRILLKHPYQRQPYRARPEILFLASNMTILDSMGGQSKFAFELVPNDLVEVLPSGKTFEEYYGLLNRLFPPHLVVKLTLEETSNGDDGDNGDENNSNGDSGYSTSLGVDFSMATESTEMWAEDGIMAIDINLRIEPILNSTKGRGTLPGSFIEIVQASLVPAINVSNLLKRFKKSILSQRRNLTRMRPSRRYGFEQMGSRYAYITKVLVAIDVSGSVDSFTLGYMLGMVNCIFKQGIAEIDVVQFDADLKLPVMPLAKAIKQYQVLGRGGTNFQPAADYYINHSNYDGLIYITDGMAPDPVVPGEARFSRPVVWIITDDDLVPTICHGWTPLKAH